MAEQQIHLIKRDKPPQPPARNRISLFVDDSWNLMGVKPDGEVIPMGSGGGAGAPGQQGAPGQSGAAGSSGEKGDKGEKGDPGPAGEPGEPGPKGDPGEKGDKGDSGQAATVGVHSVVTGGPGTDANVENLGGASAASFRFTIPRGDKGDKGERGETGSGGSVVDTPPSIPNPKDDEFDFANTLPGGSSAKWAWINQGAATASVGDSSLSLKAPTTTGPGLRILTQPVPSTPWTVTAKIVASCHAVNFHKVGLCLVSGTRVQFFGLGNDDGLGSWGVRLINYNSPTVWAANPRSARTFTHSIYLRISDDGVTTRFFYSVSGTANSWTEFFSQPRGTFLAGGATEFGLLADTETTFGPATLICDWFRVT